MPCMKPFRDDQLMAFAAIIIVAVDPAANTSAMAQSVVAAVVMFIVGCCGIYGAHKKERGSLLFVSSTLCT